VNEHGDGATWRCPIPGDANAIHDEIERLNLLKERLWAAADDLRGLDVRWTGQAHDQFVEYKDTLTRQWRHAGDLHEEAALALARYHVALVEVRRRADELVRQADYGADPVRAPNAWTDIERLREQLRRLGIEAAQAIQGSSADLATIEAGARTGDVASDRRKPVVAVAIAPQPPPIRPPRPIPTARGQSEQPGSVDTDPGLAATDPAAFERNMRVLATEILIGRHYVITPPQSADR